MTRPATLSSLPEKRFWGWGYLDDGLTAAETAAARRLVQMLGRPGPDLAPPRLEDFALPAPRKPAPAALQDIFSATPYDRLTHAYGKSFADVARIWMRHVPHAPDWVAFPRTEEDISRILEWAANANVGVVPFGGGTSVVGGVEPDVGGSYDATVSLDMERFDRILEIDRTSRAARIGAGMLGPALEAALRLDGLTLRHFPQSFQFSTLGGWIATRAGGHFATQYTHIDDFVESTRVVSPAGTFESRRLPASGAGPAPDRLVIGSEGIFGVITEAWMRLQDRPRFRASASVRFAKVNMAVSCIRALSQSGLQPTNCRLLDAAEVALARVGDGKTPTLILGFESSDHPLDAWIARALELAADHGGEWDAAELERSLRGGQSDTAQREGSAGEWRNAFLRMPYWRDETTRLGVILDTFESAVTWNRFDAFYDGVRADVADAIARVTGVRAGLSCRLTHVYPDGAAPYFSFMAQGDSDGNIGNALARWREIKAACNESIIRHGGTSTHHHAVGRDHRSGYEKEVPDLMRQAFAGAKRVLDPGGIMNPGVLIDPQGRSVGVTGATRAASAA